MHKKVRGGLRERAREIRERAREIRERAREIRARVRQSRARKAVVARRARETAIDKLMPVVDIVETRHIIVDATPEATYAAIRHLDFARVPGLLMRALTALGIRATNRARRRLGKAPLASPAKLTFDNLEQFGRILLADVPGREIVVGVIERPGDVESMLQRRTPQEFVDFDCPGHIKGAASIQLAPHGAKQTLITYETRLRATDTATRRKLFVIDRLAAPIQKIVMPRTLEFIKNAAERACAHKEKSEERR